MMLRIHFPCRAFGLQSNRLWINGMLRKQPFADAAFPSAALDIN